MFFNFNFQNPVSSANVESMSSQIYLYLSFSLWRLSVKSQITYFIKSVESFEKFMLIETKVNNKIIRINVALAFSCIHLSEKTLDRFFRGYRAFFRFLQLHF